MIIIIPSLSLICHAPFLTYFHDDYHHLPQFRCYLQSFVEINISIAMKKITETINIQSKKKQSITDTDLSLIDFSLTNIL